jgi:hypothetical protein
MNNVYLTKQMAIRLYVMANTLQQNCLQSLKHTILDSEHDEQYRRLAQNWFKETAEEYDALCCLKAQCWKIVETVEKDDARKDS